MFLEILLATLIGITAGVFTGLVPGIHVNLISVILVSLSSVLAPIFGLLPLGCFIIAMATTHTFLDVLPSIFLGAPESATALGVLPGHRYLLRGNGLMAVKLTIVGGLGSLVFSGIAFIILVPVVRISYPFLSKIMGFLLLGVIVFNLLRDKEKFWAIIIFFSSGILGWCVLNMKGLENPLFPMLSGLFGIATLLYSLYDDSVIPPQKYVPHTDIDVKRTLQAIGSGTFSGFLTAILPGVGSATAAVISMQITRKLGDHGFMVLLGGIGTSNFVLSLVTLLAIEKARNGALVAVTQILPVITSANIILFLFVALTAGGIAAIITLKGGVLFSKIIGRLPYKKVVWSIIIFLLILTPVLSGLYGLIILLVSTALGLLPAITKTSRTQGMGCILLPVLAYFLF